MSAMLDRIPIPFRIALFVNTLFLSGPVEEVLFVVGDGINIFDWDHPLRNGVFYLTPLLSVRDHRQVLSVAARA